MKVIKQRGRLFLVIFASIIYLTSTALLRLLVIAPCPRLFMLQLALGASFTCFFLFFTPVLPFYQIIDLHDKAVEGHLLRTQLLLDTCHCLGQIRIFLVFLFIRFLRIVSVELYKLLLE